MRHLGPTVFAALLPVVVAVAQLTSGSISGTILDNSGAMVPEVKIVVKEISTGVSREGATNGTGIYRIAGLEPGAYTVEYAKPGFETVRVDRIELRTSQEALLNQSMPVAIAAVSVTVESSGAGAELSKTTPTVERRVGQETLVALPLTGDREVSNLALLAPGVSYSGEDAGGNATFSANGQRQFANGILLDGVENKDAQYQVPQHQHIPEGVEEVHVMTNSFSAEFGRFLGAQISVVTRGGTNRFNGQAWEYYGANWMSAATLANKRAGLTAVRFSDHQTGGSLGGPIRKNRTFFFAMGQTTPHAEGLSANDVQPVFIPTPAGWAALQRVPLGQGQTLESRQAMLSGLSFIPDVHGEVLRYDPIESRSVNGLPVEFGRTRIPQSHPSSSWRVQGRVDHHLSSRDVLSYRFSRQEQHAPVAVIWPFNNNAFGRRFTSREDNIAQLHALTYTRVFGPSLVNEVRLSANRQMNQAIGTQDVLPRTMVTGYFNLGPSVNSPFVRPTGSYNLQDTLTWIRSRHSIKVGAQILMIRDTISGAKQSIWTFTNFQDFINNRANTLGLRLKASSEPFHSVHQSYFVQDDYKVRPNLSLNLGLRYQVSNIPAGLFGAATPEIAAAGVPVRPQPDRNDWAPRAGFAYSPHAERGWQARLLGDGATVIRGGFGIGYGVVYQGEQSTNLLGLLSNYPWNLQPSFNMSEIANLYPVPPQSGNAVTALSPLAVFVNYPTDAKNPAMHFYAFSVQRQFRRAYILELGYLGNRSYHLFQRVDANQAVLTPEQAQLVVATRNATVIPSIDQRRLNPLWRARTRLATVGTSNYNAGYAKFDRRLTKGWTVGANYTWSATLGDGGGPASQNHLNRQLEYARSENDRPHRFAVHYVWQMPGKRFWGGWRLSGLSQWQSGRPFTITTGVDSNGDGTGTSDRPNYNPSGSIRLDPVMGNWRSFSTPLDGSGRFVTPLTAGGTPLLYSTPFGGNLGRNTFRGPGFALSNLSLLKPFAISDRLGIELRADCTNLLNHRNFGPPLAIMNDANFGQNNSNPVSRVLLLSAKIRF